MIKEPKEVDFSTTGRQPSEQEFARISEWIAKDKQQPPAPKPGLPPGVIINPDLEGKYDDQPLLQDKVARANRILKEVGTTVIVNN